MKGMAIVIDVAGEPHLHPLTAPPTLEQYHQWVGGYIELIPYFNHFLGKECAAFCNEEGKLENLPINRAATDLWAEQYPQIRGVDVLVGNIVIVTGDKELLGSL